MDAKIIKSYIDKNEWDKVQEIEEDYWWDYISSYIKLSETFIEQFKNRVNWIRIIKYQKLNKEFIKKLYPQIWLLYKLRGIEQQQQLKYLIYKNFKINLWSDDKSDIG